MDLKAAPPPLTAEQRQLRRRRRRLVSYTALGVLVVLAGGGVWAYYATIPLRAAARVREGASLMSPGHFQEAVDRFNEALKISPGFEDVYARRGLAYQNLGRIDLALEDYQMALYADPRQPPVLTARGIIYRGRGEIQRAIDEFSKALAIREDSDTYYERAQTYALLGENRKAVEDFDKVVAALRDAPHVLRARAAVRLKLGDRPGYELDVAAARDFELRAQRGQNGGSEERK
jgi:tetratricopeptide (TPR) repeat protein